MITYHSIVFMQGEEADEPLRLLDEQGRVAVAAYLAQWDYGRENEHSPQKDPPWGSLDNFALVRVPHAGVYWLTWNTKLQYIGLVRTTRERKENVKL